MHVALSSGRNMQRILRRLPVMMRHRISDHVQSTCLGRGSSSQDRQALVPFLICFFAAPVLVPRTAPGPTNSVAGSSIVMQ
jgi:hypothetical protein